MKRLPELAARARVTAEIRLHRHGPWWLLLLLLAAALLGVWLTVIPRLEDALAEQRSTLARLQAQLAADQPPPAPPLPVAHANYQAYCLALRDEDAVLGAIREILDVAGKQRLAIKRAEYERSRHPDAQAEGVRMTLPIRGRYADVRAWIEAILVAQPSLAVNELTFKREEISSGEVDARVRLTIWHHPRERLCRGAAVSTRAQDER